MPETLLLVTHTETDGSLGRPALEALAATKDLAAALGTGFAVGLFGAEVKPAAAAIAGCGASRFLGASSPTLDQPRYATDAAAGEALCRAAQASVVLAPSTSRMARVMAGVTQRLGGRVDTHVTSLAAVNGSPAATRWFYRQRMEARLTRPQRPWVILLDPGTRAAWSGAAGSPRLEQVAVAIGGGLERTQVQGVKAPRSDEQTIRPDAAVLFVAGAGWTKKQADGQMHAGDAAKLILGFLRGADASLGSSKSLVDQSGEGQAVIPFMSHLNQVGQTGSTPRHPKGLATCCHGEEPHVVGWRFINERRAVNLDPSCGWARGKADVLYVADAFAVISQVNALLAERKARKG